MLPDNNYYDDGNGDDDDDEDILTAAAAAYDEDEADRIHYGPTEKAGGAAEADSDSDNDDKLPPQQPDAEGGAIVTAMEALSTTTAAAPKQRAAMPPVDKQVVDELRKVTSSNMSSKLLEHLAYSWSKEVPRAQKKLPSVDEAGALPSTDDFMRRLQLNIRTNVTEARAPVQLTKMRTLADFEREHPAAAAAAPAAVAAAGDADGGSAAPARPIVASEDDDDDNQHLLPTERLGLGIGGADDARVDDEMSRHYNAERVFLDQITQHIKFATENLNFFTQRAQAPTAAAPTSSYRPVEMDAATMRRLSVVAYEPFEPCVFAHMCVGVVMGMRPLMQYVDPAQLGAWERAPTNHAPSEGCLRMCVRCISSMWNLMANVQRKTGDNATCAQPPFYYSVDKPGGYRSSAMRVERGGHTDGMVLPFLAHHKHALRVQECVVVKADGTKQSVPCVADVDHVLYSDGSPRSPAGAAVPDGELQHKTLVLPLEHILYSRLLQHTGNDQQQPQLQLPPRDVLLSDEQSLRAQLKLASHSAVAHMQYSPFFMNHEFIVYEARFDQFERCPLQVGHVHNARVDLLLRPMTWALCRLGSLLRQQSQQQQPLEQLRTLLLLDPRQHVHFSITQFAGIERLTRAWPDFATHSILYLTLARIEFARYCCIELRAGRMRANDYQGSSRAASAPPTDSSGTPSPAARGVKRSGATGEPIDSQTAAAMAAATTVEPLCKQLEDFGDSHRALLELYSARCMRALPIDDRTLLTHSPHQDGTTWMELLGADSEPSVSVGASGTDSSDSNLSTWYQLAYPLTENYFCAGDMKYVAHWTRVVPAGRSSAFILAHSALLSLTADGSDRAVFGRLRETANWLLEHPTFRVPTQHWRPAGGHCDALFEPVANADAPQAWYIKRSVVVAALVWRVNRALTLFDELRTQLCETERELDKLYSATSPAATRPLGVDLLAELRASFAKLGSQASADALVAVMARTVLLPVPAVATLEHRVGVMQRALEGLRCFITSHCRLALCVQDARVSCNGRVDDGTLSRIPWRSNSKLSALDLFEPHDASAPIERSVLPNMVPMLRTLLLDASNVRKGAATTTSARQKAAMAAAARASTDSMPPLPPMVLGKSKAARRVARLVEFHQLQQQRQHSGEQHNTIMEMLRLAQPMACMVREFLKKHPVAMATVPAYRMFVLQVLRVALSGGYVHAKSQLSMARVVRSEWWLAMRQPPILDTYMADEVRIVRQFTRDAPLASDATHVQRVAYAAQFPEFQRWRARRLAKQEMDGASAVRYAVRNGYVVLAALRELCISMVRQDPALLACMRATVPCYGEYESAQLQTMDAFRTLYAHTGVLAEREAAAQVVSDMPKSGSRWQVFRWPSQSFVAAMCDQCKLLDEQRLITYIENNPHAQVFPTDWLPRPLVELLLSCVEALTPGSPTQFDRQWFAQLAFDDAVLDALASLYEQWHATGGVLPNGTVASFQLVLTAIPRVQYSLLRWFYYILQAHNSRLHMPLTQRMATQQLVAVRKLYELEPHEPLRPHMTCVHMCHVLGCFSVRTFYTPDDDVRLLNPDDVKLNLDAGQLQCNVSMRSKDPVDALDRPLMTSAEREQLKQQYKEFSDAVAALQQMRAAHISSTAMEEPPVVVEAIKRHVTAKKRYHTTAQQIARRLRRVSFMRPCDAWPVTEVITIGYVLVAPERARHGTSMVRITNCTRCGHPTRYAPWMHTANGFSCQMCDKAERIASALPRCAMCERPVIDYDPVRRERSRLSAAARAQQQSSAAYRTAITVGQTLQLALLDKINLGSERVRTYYAGATPGIGIVYHASNVLRIFDTNMRCVRNVYVCDRCMRPFMREQASQLTLQEMRDSLREGRSLAQLFGSPSGRGAHGGAAVRHGGTGATMLK